MKSHSLQIIKTMKLQKTKRMHKQDSSSSDHQDRKQGSISSSDRDRTKQLLFDKHAFQCPCGKKYKSYAAVYTHIKTKHPQDLHDYKHRIIKPNGVSRNELGRPKKMSSMVICCDEEPQLMNLVEHCVLDLYSIFNRESDKNKVILQTNQSHSKSKSAKNQSMKELFKTYNLESIIQLEQQKKVESELELKKCRFTLNLKEQVCKHFALPLRNHLEIQLLLIIEKQQNPSFKKRGMIAEVEKEIWQEYLSEIERIIKLLQNVYSSGKRLIKDSKNEVSSTQE